MTHEDIQSDLALYALGSLDAEERQAIEQHLAAGCDSCAQELLAWREVVGMVPFEDRALRRSQAKLMARAPRRSAMRRSRSRRQSPAVASVGRRRSRPPRSHCSRLRPIARSVGVPSASARRRSAPSGRGDRRLRTISKPRAATSTACGCARTTRDRYRHPARRWPAEEALSIVQRPGLNLVALKETKDQPPAAGHVLLSVPTGKALFYAFGLPPVPSDKTYELWWITEKDGPVQAGLFQPDERGLGRIDAAVPTGAGAIKAAAVTIEQAGGVPKPQGPMVLLGTVASPS
jgi:anti-sigma-K factor RskA